MLFKYIMPFMKENPNPKEICIWVSWREWDAKNIGFPQRRPAFVHIPSYSPLTVCRMIVNGVSYVHGFLFLPASPAADVVGFQFLYLGWGLVSWFSPAWLIHRRNKQKTWARPPVGGQLFDSDCKKVFVDYYKLPHTQPKISLILIIFILRPTVLVWLLCRLCVSFACG